MQPHEDHRKSANSTYSDAQLAAIEAVGGDVIVLAGAGAGKTRTLVARLLHLLARAAGAPDTLADGAHADGAHHLRAIAAVTFTEKAAREMRNRLRQEVTALLADPGLAAAERTYWQHIGDDLDAARIGTIHSLCAEILRSHPEEAHIDPRFGVLDEAAALLARQDAVDAALAWASADSEASTLFRRFQPETLRSILEELLADRLAVQPLLAAEPWLAWEAHCMRHLHSRLVAVANVQDAMTTLAALAAQGSVAAAAGQGDAFAGRLLQLLPAWEKLRAGSATLADLHTQLLALKPLLALTGVSKTKWRSVDPPTDLVKQIRKCYDEDILPLLAAVDPALDAELAALLPQVRRLFEQTIAAYVQAKRDRAALDFDDLEQKALDLLARPAVRERWQGQIKALLVDEFQDTNGRQRDLLRHIAGERGCLFVVGDAKQSIYRFRGAQVHVFFEVLEDVRRRRGTVVELAASYRTHAALLDGLNALMQSVLSPAQAAGAARPWHAPFAALSPVRAGCDHGLAAPFVELHLAAGTKSEGALETAARALAARLAELKQASGGTLGYGDIAILCRGSGSFPPYEAALEEAGIPYVTVAGRGFYDRPEIRDLRTTLQALADPTDDLALAGLLRSAAVGLDDPALFDLRFGPNGGLRPLWPALQATAQEPDAPEHLVRAADLVATHHALAGRTGVADLLKRWLDATDYLATLAAAGNARAERNVAKLLDDAHRSGLVSVAEFLEYVANVRDVGGREGEARADDAGAVQIMTVHKAKGLEFPLVVIGDAGAGGASGRSRLLADETLGVVVKLQDAAGRTPLVWALAQAQDADQEAAEANRLFYVAATRSADKLIVSGTLRLGKEGSCGQGEGWLKQLLAALDVDPLPAKAEAEGAGVHVLTSALGGQAVGGALYELNWWPEVRTGGTDAVNGGERNELDRTTAQTDVGAMVGAVGAAAGSSLDGAAGQPTGRLVWRVTPAGERPGAPAWLVGNLVHEAIAAWRLPVDGGLAAWVRARARTYGLGDEARLDDAVVKVRRLLRRFQDSPAYAEIAGAERRLHELPYSWLHDGREQSGVIDLLYCRDGAWTLVDFKTDRIRTPDERTLVLEGSDYRQQVRRYAAAVAGLAGIAADKIKVLICLLDDRGQVSVEPVPYWPEGFTLATAGKWAGEPLERDQSAGPEERLEWDW